MKTTKSAPLAFIRGVSIIAAILTFGYGFGYFVLSGSANYPDAPMILGMLLLSLQGLFFFALALLVLLLSLVVLLIVIDTVLMIGGYEKSFLRDFLISLD